MEEDKPKRIHIVGCSPRSGTTLMTELMVNCFDIDGFAEHEMSIFEMPEGEYKVYCSKWPHDIDVMRPLLWLDPQLWSIFMLRDPRDVIVSHHPQDPNVYWSNLRLWKRYTTFARKLAGHPRFIMVRYEDLVREPDRVQNAIAGTLPFLNVRARFSEYHRIAEPSERSVTALRGVRALDTRSIGRWRAHKPRVAAQLQLHGPVGEELIHYGYESNHEWRAEVEAVEPDHFASQRKEREPLEQMTFNWWRVKRIVKYALTKWSISGTV
jgi:hypothetical protein